MPGVHTYDMLPAYIAQVNCAHCSKLLQLFVHGQLHVEVQLLDPSPKPWGAVSRSGAQAPASGGNVGGGASSPAGAQAPELAQPASATGASGWASPASAPDCGNGRSAAAQQPLGSDGGAPGRTHVPASDPRAGVRRRRRRCLDARWSPRCLTAGVHSHLVSYTRRDHRSQV